MSKAKRDNSRKENLIKFKEKQKTKKRMSEDQKLPSEVPQLPEVRNVPVWDSQETISMNGLEFEAIFNFINGVSAAYSAVSSIMNKNILTGAVKMSFEKLTADKSAYVAMTEEEQAPYLAEFESAIAGVKSQLANIEKGAAPYYETADQKEQYPEPPSQEGLPQLDALVDADGHEVNKPTGKLVGLDGKEIN